MFDLPGHPVASRATPYATNFPEPGWAEQDLSDWWAAVGVSVRGAMSQAGIAVEDVLSHCVDTTCSSVVALDESGKPFAPQ